MFGRNKEEKREDDDTFNRRIRTVIEEKTCATSGIKVFEHEDESALDDYEQQVLATLKEAHEKWKKSNSDDSDHEDAFKSVKVRVDKL